MSDDAADPAATASRGPSSFELPRRSVLAGGVAVTAAGLFGRGTPPAAAAPTSGVPAYPPKTPELQPGDPDRLQRLLSYDPNSDPMAKYVRSRVPLAKRIAPDRATQANPKIDPRPQLLNIERQYFDVGNPSNVGDLIDNRYGHGTGAQVARNVSYVDYTDGWNCAQNVINAAYIDRAHRNGILALGVIFNPFFVTDGSDQPDLITRAADGSFPAGDKLVDLAQWFGYDGYFLNIEMGYDLTPAQASDLAELFRRMKSRAEDLGLPAFYLQTYDSRAFTGELDYEAKLDPVNSGWITDGGCDSLFVNYNWPINFPEAGWSHPGQDFVADSLAEAARVGIDPITTTFYGMDMQEQLDNKHAYCLDAYADQVLPRNGVGEPRGSLAFFVSTDGWARVIGRKQTGESDQAYLERLWQEERRFWSGPSGNPAVQTAQNTATITELTQPGYVPTYGVANFLAERSVVGSLPFTTRFNVGTGSGFALAGRPASQTPWYDVGIADVLPTWQFWTRSMDSGEVTDGLLSVDFDSTVAYDGGSSLVINGSLAPQHPTELLLYKTDLAFGDSTQVAITYREGTQGAGAALQLGIVTSDGTTATTIWHRPESADDLGGGWRRVLITPGAGRVAAISLGFSSTRTADYKINIGELSIRNAGPQLMPPAAPTGFRVDGTLADNGALTVGFSWDLDPDVWYYDLRLGTGTNTVWIGRISSDCYLAGDTPGLTTGTTVHLVAVSRSGVESRAARIRI
ncbi:MAG: hypothetical protein J2P23_01015 [Microlunatus sp.]|nr:hypothetical protein [Microlunatus sp.]